jgi:hypothetical protein
MLLAYTRTTSDAGYHEGSAELPTLVGEAQGFHRNRANAHAPGSLLPVPNANHYTILTN